MAADGKLTTAYGKARAAGGCINSTTAMTVEGKVDNFITDLKNTLAPGLP